MWLYKNYKHRARNCKYNRDNGSLQYTVLDEE